jgi:hypothetical protein
MRQLLKRKWAWACEKPRFWSSLLLTSITLGIVFATPRIDGFAEDLHLRLWSLALQILGAWTVWHDIVSTAQKFGRPGILRSYHDWFRAGLAGRSTVIHAATGALTASSARATIRVRRQPSGDQLIEQRLAAVEFNLAKVDEHLDSIQQRVDQADNDIKTRVEAEAARRSAALGELQAQMKDTAVGNYGTLLFGVLWLAVGTVLSALAPELAKLR